MLSLSQSAETEREQSSGGECSKLALTAENCKDSTTSCPPLPLVDLQRAERNVGFMFSRRESGSSARWFSGPPRSGTPPHKNRSDQENVLCSAAETSRTAFVDKMAIATAAVAVYPRRFIGVLLPSWSFLTVKISILSDQKRPNPL